MHDQSSGAGVNFAAVAVTGIALVIALIAAIGLWRLGANEGEQACIARVAQEYPGVPVSAFNGKQTGALKLSYDSERRKALNEC
ncbi:MAG: hypothetical protein ACKOH7_06215 [Solirubrobacterales bacterium]